MMKMNFEEFSKFVDIFIKNLRGNPTLRNGQVLMNTLHEMNSKIYDEIAGTEFDCFYDDEKIFATFDRIAENFMG